MCSKQVTLNLKSVLRIGSAHNKRGPSDLKIVEILHFSKLKLWFIFIYEHIANQNSVRFSVSIIFYKFRSSKINVNKTFVYITDLTSTLTSCFSLCISSVYFKTSVKKTPAIDPDKISEAIFLNS